MKVAVKITGFIEVPDTWASKGDDCFLLDVAGYHYNDKLEAEDAIDDLANKLKEYSHDFEAEFEWP